MLRSDDNGIREGTQEKEEEGGGKEEPEKKMLEEEEDASSFAMYLCFVPCTCKTLFISDIIQIPTSQAKVMSDQPDGFLDGRS